MATAPAIIPEVRRQPRLATVPGARSQRRELLFEKPIDNSNLYRELDPEKHRQCFTLLGTVVLAFAFVFFFAWEHFRCVRYGYEIEQLKSQRTALTVWNQRLHLEQALLADPQRIDRLARVNLGLIAPQSQQIVRVNSQRSQAGKSSAPVFARNVESVSPARRGNPQEP
jgi:cell division protein FtsL